MIKEKELKIGLKFTWIKEDWIYCKETKIFRHCFHTQKGDYLSVSKSGGETVFTIVGIDSYYIKCKMSNNTMPRYLYINDILENGMVYKEDKDVEESVVKDTWGNVIERTTKRVDVIKDIPKFKMEAAAAIKANLVEDDAVSHPSHYTWLKKLCGIEPIDLCRHFDFAIGNALKYILRKGKKDGDMTDKEKRIEDLEKAVFYLNDAIKQLSKQNIGK